MNNNPNDHTISKPLEQKPEITCNSPHCRCFRIDPVNVMYSCPRGGKEVF